LYLTRKRFFSLYNRLVFGMNFLRLFGKFLGFEFRNALF